MHYLNKYKFRIIFALIFSAFSSVLAIISPKRLEKLINTIIAGIITGIDMDKVKEIMFALIIIYVLSAIFDYLEKYLMVDATNKFAKEHNLKNIDVKIPLGTMTIVTGVSGSGKSTLVNDVFLNAIKQQLGRVRVKPGAHKKILGLDNIDKVVEISQDPIGRTPRSNPLT